MLITLKKWEDKICKNPKILISEEPWNHMDELIPCGKCTICKKNEKILKGIYEENATLNLKHNNRNEKKGQTKK